MQTIDLSALPDLLITGVRLYVRTEEHSLCILLHTATHKEDGFVVRVMVDGVAADALEDRTYKTQAGALRAGFREAGKLGWTP